MPAHGAAGPLHDARRLRGDGLVPEEVVQVVGHSARGLVACVRIFLHRFERDGLQVPRHARAQLPRRRGIFEQDLPIDLLTRLPGEGLLQREQLVERDAEGVHVRASVDVHLAPGDLLGAHVLGRAEHVAGHGQRLAALLSREPEVRDHGQAVTTDDDIARLDVAVHHAVGVRVVERVRDLGDHAGRAPVVGRVELPGGDRLDELVCVDLVACAAPGLLLVAREKRLDAAEHLDLMAGHGLGFVD